MSARGRSRRSGVELERDTEWSGDDDLVFSSLTGTTLNIENLRSRALRLAAEEVGAAWAGFHSFRHTCASLLFARGSNAVQVQRWLGHHSAAFTLETYVHLLADDGAEALGLDVELNVTGGNQVATSATFGPVSPGVEVPVKAA